MILKTKQTTEHEVEIEVPFFRKRSEHGMTEYIGMITEGYVHEFYETDQSQHIGIKPLYLRENEVIKAFRDWEPVPEEDFLIEYNKLLASLSLRPVIVTKEL